LIHINRFFNLIDLDIAISDTPFRFSVTGATCAGKLFELWLMSAIGKPALGLLSSWQPQTNVDVSDNSLVIRRSTHYRRGYMPPPGVSIE